MDVIKYILVTMFFLSACTNVERKLTSFESIAIDSAICNYMKLNNAGNDMVIIFKKGYVDDKISIYQFHSNFLSSIDTISCYLSYNKSGYKVIIQDKFNDNSQVFKGTYKTIDDFVIFDSDDAILIINNITGKFEIVNFGQRYMPLNEMICKVKLIIEKLRGENLTDTKR